MLYCFSDGGLTFSQMDPGIARRGHPQLTNPKFVNKLHWMDRILNFNIFPFLAHMIRFLWICSVMFVWPVHE